MIRAAVVTLQILVSVSVLACSDYVRPPGATLSGTIYYDANANGVRDSCDEWDDSYGDPTSSYAVELYSDDVEAPRFTAGAGTDRTWEIRDVPEGKYWLRLQAPRGPPVGGETHWLTLQEHPIELSLRGYEDLRNLDIGLAYPYSLYGAVGGYWAYSVVFDDLDGDGEIDAGECAVRPVTVGQVPQMSPTPDDLKQASILAYEQVPVEGGFATREIDTADDAVFWRPLDDSPAGDCDTVSLTRVSGRPNLFEARQAVTTATGTSSLRINVFEDFDGDSERDPGEPLIPGARAILAPDPSSCLIGTPVDLPTETGTIVFDDLPPGPWRVKASMGPGCYVETGCSLTAPTPTWGDGITVTASADGSTEVNLGYEMKRLSELVVEVAEDADSDGILDDGEKRLVGANVCYRPSGATLVDATTCRPTSSTGTVRFRVTERSGEVFVAISVNPNGESIAQSPPLPWSVPEGETASLVLMVPPS
jgi:hypothetical protein